MKNIILILFFIVNISCKPSLNEQARMLNKVITHNPNSLYMVRSIDSTNMLYHIVVARNDSLFKIISNKVDHPINCNKIELSNEYNFNIKSFLEQTYTVQNVDYIVIEEETINLEDKFHRNLYYSDAISGLCFDLKKARRH